MILICELGCVWARFPTGVENMGGGGCAPHWGEGSSKFDGGGLSQYMGGGAWGGGLKCCQKIPVMEFI